MTFQGDIYARYQCFDNAESFATAVRKSAPIKIDIGAVFNAKPSEHKSLPAPIVPLERELIFDIDLTDYDPVRTCCSKTAVCQKCFIFMSMAIKTLNDLLRRDFGFQHLLFVFSGRRGIHCWVCDTNARLLSNMERSAVADYLSIQVIKDNVLTLSTPILDAEKGFSNVDYARDKSSNWTRLHPSLDRIYNSILLPTFEKVIVEEQIDFSNESHQETLLKDVPLNVADALREEWAKSDTANSYKWKKFKFTMLQCFKDGLIRNSNPILDVVFRYCYPRLDINVSKGINHLLKSPFVVHPSTGNVCVPIDPDFVDDFLLKKVPKLGSIMAQLDQNIATDMDVAVADFRRLFLDPLDSQMRKERISKKQIDRNPLDF